MRGGNMHHRRLGNWRVLLFGSVRIFSIFLIICSAKIDPQGLRQRRCKDLVVKGRDGEFEAYFGQHPLQADANAGHHR
jgi:hypothetical protein